MTVPTRIGRVIGCVAAVGGSAGALAGELAVVSVEPARHAAVAPGVAITVRFDRAVDRASVEGSLGAFGSRSGVIAGTVEYSEGDTVVTLVPDRAFGAGEVVTVGLSDGLLGADGSPLRGSGYAWQFRTTTRRAPMAYDEIAEMSNRINGAQTRIYGAAAVDLDRDGWPDLTTVNEVSADLRVFMNRGDGTGQYDDFLRPPRPIGVEASPNEAADFNGDGFADLCTGNTSSNSVSIVLGNGDGTFGPHQEVPVGTAPHGVTALDIEGDGDADIVVAVTGSNNLRVLLNNGSGVFTAQAPFEGGGNAEYGLSAGDMNNDGIMDLVIGCRDSQTVVVRLGNGNGTFAAPISRSCGGNVWVVTLGDLNGDGNLDVTTANSGSSNGGVLFGNGDGTLDPVTTYAAPVGCVSSDLGDLDGDGDLDWVLSSFGGGRWRVFTNNGAGVFAFDRDIVAPSNPSCAVLLDFDRDGDLDMALTDEIADVILLMESGCDGDWNGDGAVNSNDFFAFLDAYFLGDADFGNDGGTDSNDFFSYLTAFFEGC